MTAVRSVSDIEASCLEVAIRALGYRALTDHRGETLKGESFEEDSTTMLLFPQGAVIRLATPVACGHDLMLINKRTNRYVHCRVTNVRTSPDVKSYVEVEFTHTTLDFWGISLPNSAVKAASAVATFAAQMPAEPPTDAYGEFLPVVPARALAATAAAAPTQARSAAVVPWPAMDSSVATLPDRGAPQPQSDELSSQATVILRRPVLTIPVCEPVCEPVVALAEIVPMERVETVPAPEPMKWDAVSVPEPRGKRSRLAVAAAAALCAIALGYRFYSPAEAARPVVLQAVSAQTGDGLQPAGGTSPAAVPGGAFAAGPAGVGIVTAPAPEEIPTVETPRQRVVLVSRMTVPVHDASGRPHDAPELAATAGEGEVPGNTSGLLAPASPVPPPAEPAQDNVEKSAEPVTPARLVASAQPIYPAAAKRAQIEGNVVVEAEIDTSGNVVGTKVLSGPPALREAAAAALAKWKFQPARLGNQPTASTSVVTLQFRLR
ncbi:MAG TPA: energy transducer TonB [Candidatus Acidoferrales bacterium]|nr:energy transducer TonB [Candidatus Acidoferrales bacterium]